MKTFAKPLEKRRKMMYNTITSKGTYVRIERPNIERKKEMKKYWVEMRATVIGYFAVEIEAENDEQAITKAKRRFCTAHGLQVVKVVREILPR